MPNERSDVFFPKFLFQKFNRPFFKFLFLFVGRGIHPLGRGGHDQLDHFNIIGPHAGRFNIVPGFFGVIRHQDFVVFRPFRVRVRDFSFPQRMGDAAADAAGAF